MLVQQTNVIVDNGGGGCYIVTGEEGNVFGDWPTSIL